ncbi:MAG: DHH family phosphoesterase [Porphyromonadaceae bacterium]|nr:DHH family phosphoesterase [Porphyromonadaceae bacterium]
MVPRILSKREADEMSQLIDMAKRIVIVCHVSPDGDAIGASLAMWHMMNGLGKETYIIVPDQYPADFRFLKGCKEILVYTRYTEFAESLISQADLIFCLDFNDPQRVDLMCPALTASKAKKILIDHHLHAKSFCDMTFSHPEISSTCEVLFRVICNLGLYEQMTVDAANAIYTGMMTDTGNFTYNSNSREIYLIIAELIKKGINKDAIYARIHNTNSEDKLRLNSYAIFQKMEVYPQYSAAIILLTQEELNRYHYQKGDTEGLVNVPLSMGNILFSAFLREESNLIKVSLRSKGNFPANKIATDYFNGGGHLNAAGGEFYGTLEEAGNFMRGILPVIGDLAAQLKQS